MANTEVLKREVEQYVRLKLGKEFGQRFESRRLALKTGGDHEFDAVSLDERVVAAIKSSSVGDATGRNPGGIKSAIAELYFLTLADAPTRFLVLTDPEFYGILKTEIEESKRLAPGVSLRRVRLPAGLRR